MSQKEQPLLQKVLVEKDTVSISRDTEENLTELLDTIALLKAEKAKWKVSLEEFDNFYNNAPCGYHTIDENGLILRMNQTQLQWLGYTHDELVNRVNILDLVSEKSHALFYKYMPMLKEGGKVDQIEAEFIHKSGTVLHALVSARALLDEEGNLKGVESFAIDISDRLKMEDAMLNATRQLRSFKQRFEENNALVLKLTEELQLLKKEQNELYNASRLHIATPLEKVSALCNKLIHETELQPDSLQYLEQVHEMVKEVNVYVNNSLLQQRVAADDILLHISRFNLSGLLITVVNQLENLAEKKKLTINCEIFEDVWLKSDGELLGQVVDSLLSAVLQLAMPGTEIPLRLIRKVNEFKVELEIPGLTLNRTELDDYLDEYKQQLDAVDKWSHRLLDSLAVKSLIEKLGLKLSVSALSPRGTLLRLGIPADKEG